jgi:hypothetical protein
MTTNTPITGAARSSAVSFAVTVGNAGYGIITTGGSGNTKFDDCWRFNPLGVEPDYK